jgi:uncharacterized protein
VGRKPSLTRTPQFRLFLERLDKRYHPSRVLLYGSRSRGEERPDSDIDLVIVAEAFEGVPWLERLHRVCRLWEGDISIEPLCYTPKEFELYSNQITIVREAARTGIPLSIPKGRRATP